MDEEKFDLDELVDIDETVPLSDEAPNLSSSEDALPDLIEESTPQPRPTYGAPQSLFEDIIPAEFLKEDLSASDEGPSEKDRLKDAKKAEKEAEKEAKRAEKDAKKRAKTAALIARVEADAVRQAKADIKRESGEDYEPPEEKASAEESAPASPAKVAAKSASAAPIPAAKKAPAPAPKKEYSREESKLRKKYKLNKDILLSGNDVIPGFVLAKGEHVIRSYQCLACSDGAGTLCLTNKRLLVDAGELSETAIENVSGIKFRKQARFSIPRFLVWFLFLLLGGVSVALPLLQEKKMTISFLSFIQNNWQSYFPKIFYICGAVFLLIALFLFFGIVKKTFYFYIYAKQEALFLESKNHSCAKREKQNQLYKYVVTNAGKESEKAARELGALIIEVKEGRYRFR